MQQIPIKIITDKKELEGTCYFEIMPGRYKGSCWKDGSIFFEEEVFSLIEPAFERHVPKYDHYAFTDISKEQWNKILEDLASTSMIDNFAQEFDSKREDTKKLIEELTVWVLRQLEKEDYLAVLGL